MTKLSDKNKLINKEVKKLNAIFKDMPADKKKLCEGLIQNAAFMHVTLLELQQEVLEHGAMIQATSGNGFDTIKDNPAQKAYTTMISRYSAIIDQLQKMLPSDNMAQNNDELLDFLRNS